RAGVKRGGDDDIMATFTIDEQEYELKLTFESVKRLNKAFDGGSLEIIGLAMAGDLDAFPSVLHAGLLHTGEKFTQKKINEAIEQAFENETDRKSTRLNSSHVSIS